MNTSSSSSSDGESETERKRKLQEAVSGVNISPIPPKKKAKPSNRAPVQQEADTSGQLVTREMQSFLSRKLSEFLDSHYESTVCSPQSVKSSREHTSIVSNLKLLSDSRQPILLEQRALPSTSRKPLPQTQKTTSSDTESSDSEEENHRLQEAAIDTETILNKR